MNRIERMKSASYGALVEKLGRYSRKYYRLQFLNGLLALGAVLIGYVGVFYVIEFNLYTSSVYRLAFLFSFIVLLIGGLVLFTGKALLVVTNLRRPKLSEQAQLVSAHFPELKDYLVNIVELGDIQDANLLILHSLEQKIARLSPFSFRLYFQFSMVSKRLLIAACIALAFLATGLAVPGFVSESTYRIVHFNQQFLRPAPFAFVLVNPDLSVSKGASVELNVQCSGSQTPQNLYVVIGGSKLLMEAHDGVFSYRLQNVQNSFSFYFTDLTYVSEKFQLEIIPEPVVLAFGVHVKAPDYTRLAETDYLNQGSFSAPFGSLVSWRFECGDTDELKIVVGQDTVIGERDGSVFKAEYRCTNDFEYQVLLSNGFHRNTTVVTYQIEVIPDLFPEIRVVQLQDSVRLNQFYFKGVIGDDYGFNSLIFNLKYADIDTVYKLDIDKNSTNQDFYYFVDFNEFGTDGGYFSYWFSVFDNDFISGFKRADSEVFQFKLPGAADFAARDNQSFTDIEKSVSNAQQIANELKEAVNQFRYKSVSEKLSDWEKQQAIRNIALKRQELENSLNSLKQLNQQRNNQNNSFGSDRSELLEKQQQIDQLLSEMMNDELKKLFDEFNKLADEFNSDRLDELTRDYSMKMEDLSKQLDRNIEMLKRLKIEQDIERGIEQVRRLENQAGAMGEKFSRGTKFESIQSELSRQQADLDSVEQAFRKALELNEELDKPMRLFNLDEEFNSLKKKQSEVINDGEHSSRKKTERNLGEMKQQLGNLAFAMEQMLRNNAAAQNAENIANLKQILKNLIYVSLHQEDILILASRVSTVDPGVGQVQKQQDLIKDESKVLKDSLYALAKRTPAISAKVNGEISQVENGIANSIENLREGYFDQAIKSQQTTITSFNELALLLNEALEDLERAQSNSMPGDQECEKPGQGGKSSMQKLKDAQQSLKDQMQRMIEEMKKGSGGRLSEEVGKTLFQQDMMKKLIQDALTDSEIGSSAKEQLRAIDQIIEQNRIDLIQKNITSSLVVRQNQILDRLLKAEKSEFERDFDDKRESNTAKQIFYSNPANVFEYNRTLKNKDENIRYYNLQLRSYYDQKYKDYINKLNE